MKKTITTVITLLFVVLVYGQQTILMSEVNGVYYIPCKVNGIEMNFVLDTGASDISISLTEAQFLIKQGLLQEKDFIEKTNYKIADGSIIEGTKIILSSIKIGKVELKDVEASIVHNQTSPLLLGQSAIKKMGPISINGNKLTFKNQKSDDYIDLEETTEWLNKNLTKWAYNGSDFSVNYFLTLMEGTNGGYVLSGIRYHTQKDKITTEHLFLIPIYQIDEIVFKEIVDNSKIYIMMVTAKDAQNSFVINTDGTASLAYPFLLESSMNSENMQERFTKAFKSLIQTNQKFIKEKF